MKVLVFKTDIKSKRKIRTVKPLFQKHPNIVTWSVDTEDIDNVLRLEVTDNISENDIINMVSVNGFSCCELE